MKGAISAQKALQGSEKETREVLGGTEENNIVLGEGKRYVLQANHRFQSITALRSSDFISLRNLPLSAGKFVFRSLARHVKVRPADLVDPSTSFISASLLRSREAVILHLETTKP